MRIASAKHRLTRRDNDGDYSHSEAETEVSFDLDDNEPFSEAINQVSDLLVDANRHSIEAQRHARSKARTATPPQRQVEAEPRGAKPDRQVEAKQAQQGEALGELWGRINKKGKAYLGGKIFGTKVYIPNDKPGEMPINAPDQDFETVGSLNDSGGKLVGECEGQPIVCVKNTNKKNAKMPDWKVYIAEGSGAGVADDDDIPF